MRQNIRMLLFIVALLMPLTNAHAGSVPAAFNLDGVITDNSNNPVANATADLTVQIYDPSSNCLLREETFSGLTLTSGRFSANIGSGSLGPNDPGLTILGIFDNKGTSPIRTSGA